MKKENKTAPIPLSNAFAPLMQLDDITSNIFRDQTVKENKPLPIYLPNVININQFITDIKSITADNFRHVSTNGKMKLSSETAEGYRKIVIYLKTISHISRRVVIA